MKMAFVGDVSPGEHYFSFGHGTTSSLLDMKGRENEIFSLLKDFDVAVCNLEGTLSLAGAREENPNSMVFRGRPEIAHTIKNLGFNVINVANNHSSQHGEEAFLETIDILYAAGMEVIGQRKLPYITKDISDIKVTFLGASLARDNVDQHQELYYKPSDEELINLCEQLARQCDLLVLYVHWGDEGDVEPVESWVKLGYQLREKGVGVIVGHHPHVVQPILFEENFLCAFSLGNFIFDLAWSKKNVDSLILFVELTKHAKGLNIVARIRQAEISTSGIPKIGASDAGISKGLNTVFSYKNREFMPEPLKKLWYFVKHLMRGNTKLKIRFFIWKLATLKL